MAKLQQRAAGHVSSDTKNWINLRDANGNLQARYHPKLRLLLIQERKTKTLHDLSKFDGSTGACQDSKNVL